jgi:hypothetical protein
MSPGSKTRAPQPKTSEGILGRIFGRGGNETTTTDTHSGKTTGSTLNLSDIQGFIFRGYRMPMVRHFLLTVNVPAEARKLLGRLVSGE